MICATNDFVQLAQSLALLINEQFRATDDVNEAVCAISNRSFVSSSSAIVADLIFFRREGGDNFFEARIAPQRVPVRMQTQLAVA